MKLPETVRGVVGKPIIRKIVLWFVGVVGLLGLLGFLVAPAMLRPFAEKQLTELLHRPVSITELAINPYALSATVKGLSIKGRAGDGAETLGFDELYVNAEAESLFRGAPVLGEVRLVGPRVHLVRNADKTYNVSDLIEEFLNKPDTEPKARYAVYNIRVSGGRLELDDKPMGRVHTVADLEVGVPFVSNLPSKLDVFVQPSLSAKVNGAALAFGGKARPFASTKDASLDINLTDLDLTRYFDYLPLPLNFKLVSAKLATKLDVDFAQPEGKAPTVVVKGNLALNQLATVGNDGKPLLAFSALKVNGLHYALAEHRLNLADVSLDGFDGVLIHNRDGSLNLTRLVAEPAQASSQQPPQKPAAEAAPAKASSPALQFAVGKLRINQAKLALSDLAPASPVNVVLSDFNLAVDQLADQGKTPAAISLSFATDGGAAFKHEGKLNLAPLAAEGKLELVSLPLKTFMPYLAPLVRFSLEDGKLDASGQYQFTQTDGQSQVQAKELALGLKSLRLRQASEKQPFFTLASINASGGELDLAQKTLTVAELKSSGGKLQAVRLADGSFDLEKLLADEHAKPAAAPAAKAPASPVAKAAPAKRSKVAVKPGSQANPWQVSLKKLALDGWGLRLDDKSQPNALPIVIDGLALTADNLGTAKGKPINLTLKAGLGKRGALNLAGSVVPEPAQAKLSLDMKGLDLVPLQAYFTDHFNVSLSSGALNAKGQIAFDAGKAGQKASGGYKGNLGLTNLRLIDRGNSSDLVVWKTLQIGGVDATLNSKQAPYDVLVKEISLADFYIRLVVNSDGTLALRKLVKAEAEAEGAAKPAEAPAADAKVAETKPTDAKAPDAANPLRVQVDKVTLQGGRVNFSDYFIRPNYSANLTDIGGSVAGLSSAAGTTAPVDLRGSVDGTAPLNIVGKVNPLAKDLFLDLKADAKGIELAGLSPYSARYAGYAIEKGKLSVDIRYFIENRKLQAENHVFLDQLTFGQRVESAEATKLPVLLAVALLKNRRGEIDINLPVGGSLDDPQFSVGGIVVKVIVNVLVKAVTSPFALLGSMFGGGEELGYLEYEPGRYAIDKTNEEKLKKLSQALADRPALKLDITGRADPATDIEGIKRAQLERKVRAAKLKETLKKGDDAGALDEVTVSKEEWPKYLALAYKDEKMPKPRNIVGLAKDLPPDEMEKLMLANASVSDDGLLNLANRRAKAVEDWLVKQGGIATDRVFVVSAKLKADDAKSDSKLKPNRVDLSLK